MSEPLLSELQSVAVAWHRGRFPTAHMEHVALKVCEEAGEVGCAINGVAGHNSATGKGEVGDEAADVLIATLVLLGRWFPDVDLAAAVAAKLAILIDPEGGHRACARLPGAGLGGDAA